MIFLTLTFGFAGSFQKFSDMEVKASMAVLQLARNQN